MKKSELTFRALLVPLDLLATMAAGWFAYALRFGPVRDLRPVLFELPFEKFIVLDAAIAVLTVVALALGGAYSLRPGRRAVDEIRRVFLGCTVALAAASFLVFLRIELVSSRFIVLTGWAAALVLVTTVHLVVRSLQRAAYRAGRGIHRCLVIGSDEATAALVAALGANPSYGLQVVDRRVASDELVSQLAELHSQHRLDEIIVADVGVAPTLVLALKDYSDSYQLTFRYVASLFQAQVVNTDIETIAGLPVVEVLKTRLSGWGKVFKRGFDLVLALVGSIILLPFAIVLGVIIKMNSQGPILVGLDRVGANGKTFRLWKFRSMVNNAHSMKPQLAELNERTDGPLFKVSHDPRVTSVGKFLRRYSIDELAQLLNVIAGQISLVGPRPHEPGEVARYDSASRKLLAIKPGITGLAQISGRSSLKFSDEVRLDMYYVENWSPLLDVQILLKTPFVVFSGREAV
jgi:exopolysaccharide biosynthesis polyprenyl glycosylphosphotransferase